MKIGHITVEIECKKGERGMEYNLNDRAIEYSILDSDKLTLVGDRYVMLPTYKYRYYIDLEKRSLEVAERKNYVGRLEIDEERINREVYEMLNKVWKFTIEGINEDIFKSEDLVHEWLTIKLELIQRQARQTLEIYG